MMAAAGGAALLGGEGGAEQDLGAPGGEAAAVVWLEGDGGDGHHTPLLGEEGARDEVTGQSKGQHWRVLATTGLQQPKPISFLLDPSLSDTGMTNPCIAIMLPSTGMTNPCIMIMRPKKRPYFIKYYYFLRTKPCSPNGIPQRQHETICQGACPI